MSGHPDLVEVGRIGKPHGVVGALLVRLITNNLDRIQPGSQLWCLPERILTVTSSRPHGGDRWVVTFEGVADRDSAAELTGSVLAAEAVRDDPDSYWIHDLIGAEVVDEGGRLAGVVERVLDNPAADILELDSGILVPLSFCTWQTAPGAPRRRLVAEGPPGLLDDTQRR